MLLFHQSTMHIILRLISVSTSVTWYIVVKSLYNTFLIHRELRTLCIPSPCIKNNYKVRLWGNFGRGAWVALL